jgi:hypothetical protein
MTVEQYAHSLSAVHLVLQTYVGIALKMFNTIFDNANKANHQ